MVAEWEASSEGHAGEVRVEGMGWVGGDSWKGGAGTKREVGFARTGSRRKDGDN